MKTVENRAGRGHRGAVLWMLMTAGAVCLAEPSLAAADEPTHPTPPPATTAAPKPRAQARPAPVVSLRREKQIEEARKTREEQSAFQARVAAAGVCGRPEIATYRKAAKVDIDPTLDPKKKRAEILRIAKDLGITDDLKVPAEADLSKKDGPKAIAGAQERLEDAAEKKQEDAKTAFLSAARSALTEGGNTCDDRCAARAFNQCTGTGAKTTEGALAAIPSVEGLASFQTSLVTGLAKFLQTRAEAEITTWLMTQVQKDLCSSEGKGWFPETCALFDDGNGYSVNSGTSLLATAVRKDLERLPAHAVAYATGIDDRLAVVLVDTLWKVRDGQKPLELIAGLGVNPVLQELCDGGKEISNMTACVLRAAGYAAAHSGDALTAESFEAELPKLAKEMLADVSLHLPKVGGGAGLDEENIKELLRAVVALQTQLAEWSKPESTGAPSAAEKAGIAVRLSLSVIGSAVTMFGDEKVQATWNLVSHGLSSASEILQGHPSEAVHELLVLLREAKTKLPGNVARHIALIADLAAAKDANDVQATLEAAAAPVGSYLEKRRGPMLSASGIVGLSIGAEVPANWGYGRRLPDAAFSPMAMVGLDLSFPCGRSTVGVYLSLLDVGQLLALPFGAPAGQRAHGTDESAAVNDEVQVAQVLSPGLFFRVGIDKTPLTWGIGASYAPQLRTYIERDVTTRKEVGRELFDVFRLQTFLAVDVTLLPFKRF